MIRSRAALAFGLVAVVAWAGEAIFFVANAFALGSVAQSLWRTASFLTDWSGILVATVTTATLLRWRRLASPWWCGLATVAIVLVGTMFAVMGGWASLAAHGVARPLSFSSLLAHVVTPWSMLLVWLFVADHGRLVWRDAARFGLFPVAYLIQMFVRGALGGGYPYPEVDVGRVGWSAALAFAAAVTLLYALLGLLLVAADRMIARRSASIETIPPPSGSRETT